MNNKFFKNLMFTCILVSVGIFVSSCANNLNKSNSFGYDNEEDDNGYVQNATPSGNDNWVNPLDNNGFVNPLASANSSYYGGGASVGYISPGYSSFYSPWWNYNRSYYDYYYGYNPYYNPYYFGFLPILL